MSDREPIELMVEALQRGAVIQSETAGEIANAIEKYGENMTTSGVAAGVLIGLTYALQHVYQVDPDSTGKDAVRMMATLLRLVSANIDHLSVGKLLDEMSGEPEGHA